DLGQRKQEQAVCLAVKSEWCGTPTPTDQEVVCVAGEVVEYAETDEIGAEHSHAADALGEFWLPGIPAGQGPAHRGSHRGSGNVLRHDCPTPGVPQRERDSDSEADDHGC